MALGSLGLTNDDKVAVPSSEGLMLSSSVLYCIV